MWSRTCAVIDLSQKCKLYKVKYYNHISDSDYTLEQAKERVEYLNSTFKGCNAHMVEIKE